jgi:hypothetical protein
MEEICSSETSVKTQRTTRRVIPEDDALYNHRCENLKSYIYLNNFYNHPLRARFQNGRKFPHPHKLSHIPLQTLTKLHTSTSK